MEVRSGERLGGVGCGIVVSNNSDRRRVEKVRLASSAAEIQTKYNSQFLQGTTDFHSLL